MKKQQPRLEFFSQDIQNWIKLHWPEILKAENQGTKDVYVSEEIGDWTYILQKQVLRGERVRILFRMAEVEFGEIILKVKLYEEEVPKNT